MGLLSFGLLETKNLLFNATKFPVLFYEYRHHNYEYHNRWNNKADFFLFISKNVQELFQRMADLHVRDIVILR